MSDNHWRDEDGFPVIAAVDSTTVIEIGDLVWQDVDDAKPASSVQHVVQAPSASDLPDTDLADGAPVKYLQDVFAEKFLGVAMQRSHNGDTAPVRVATTGVFEFECSLKIFELGDLMGAIPNDTGKLQNQAVGPVASSRCAIGRVAKREASPATSVLVDIRSTVMTGGVAGSSCDGV